MMGCSKGFLFCSICFEIKVFRNKNKKLLTMIKCLTLSVSFAVWLIREMTKIISGYIERVNEKAVVAYYENFTNFTNFWTYIEFKKADFQNKSLIIVLIKRVDIKVEMKTKLKNWHWTVLHNPGIPSTQAHIKNNKQIKNIKNGNKCVNKNIDKNK